MVPVGCGPGGPTRASLGVRRFPYALQKGSCSVPAPRASPLARAAGVPRSRLHDLRHTHATLLPRAGTPIKVLSERLGNTGSCHITEIDASKTRYFDAFTLQNALRRAARVPKVSTSNFHDVS